MSQDQEDQKPPEAFELLEREFKKVWTALEGPRGQAEAQITKSPWAAVAIVGLCGLILGFILGRGRSE